jgi:hypothetical protein
MVSPDWSTYVDLTPYDVTVSSILEESLTQAKALLPEWSPKVGEVETTLLEATAYQTANLANAANRLPGATVETLLKLFAVNRSNGVKATATVGITFSDNYGHSIPATTAFAYFGTDGSAYVYTFDADTTVASGSTTLASVAVTAQSIGTGYNIPSNGSSLQSLAVLPYVKTTVLDSKPTGGLNAETDLEYFNRAVTLLKSYSSVLATEQQLASHVLATYVGSIFRAKAYNTRRYSDRDLVTGGGTHNGYVLLSVAGENVNGYPRAIEDATVSAANVSTISTAVASKTGTGLTVEVHNAELVGIGVTCEVFKLSTAASGTVSGAVQTVLEKYFDSDAWDWSRVVRKNEVISLLDNVTGIDYVKSVTLSLPEEAVVAASTANLSADYVNGTVGVGATLTNNSTQAAFATDGQTPSSGDRVLIKDQTAALQNGVYEVTTVGDGSSNWVLTRSTDADTTNEMIVDKFVWVTAGTTNGSKGFSCSAAGTIGTDSISFVQTSTAVRAEVLASNVTDGTGGLTGDIRMNRLGMLTYPSTLTITVS